MGAPGPDEAPRPQHLEVPTHVWLANEAKTGYELLCVIAAAEDDGDVKPSVGLLQELEWPEPDVLAAIDTPVDRLHDLQLPHAIGQRGARQPDVADHGVAEGEHETPRADVLEARREIEPCERAFPLRDRETLVGERRREQSAHGGELAVLHWPDLKAHG